MELDLKLFENNTDYWQELESSLDGLDKDKIKKVFDFAYEAHHNQVRESGEAYISHPTWIAKVTAQLAVGEEAIMAALLHDCVEDTAVTIDEISDKFGDEVALLVAGLTDVKKKTSGIEVHQTSIEVFRKFLFSSVNDVRVLIIRLVDKVHNGLTLEHLSEERQIKFANRAVGIYSPVAEYVGLHYFKKILDDIAFKISHPKEYKELVEYFKSKKSQEEKALEKVKSEVEKILKINNLNDCLIEGRVKSLFSTYQKIKKKGESRLKDGIGVRIITTTISECYSILGLLHARFNYIPECFDDYISSPKPNGYRSLQTTLNWDDDLTVEIQIRTQEMHEFNEFGPASHVAYKMSRSGSGGMGYEWLRDLVNWQKSDKNINNYTIKVLEKFIYVFTPKGDTIQLPVGSTGLDFAYRIHTEVGHHCLGIKVNKKMEKIDKELKTGDFVEVLVGKKINVNKNWLDIAKTAQAREHIKRYTIGYDD